MAPLSMTPGRSLPANTSGRSSAPQAITMAWARTMCKRWRGTPWRGSAVPGAVRSITPTVLPSYRPKAVARVSSRTRPVAFSSASVLLSQCACALSVGWFSSEPPASKSCSTSVTSTPACAARSAALSPAGPEPITSRSVKPWCQS